MLNKNPSCLRFKHKDIASIEITHSTKSFMAGENLFALTVVWILLPIYFGIQWNVFKAASI